jgi:hypothetical protein
MGDFTDIVFDGLMESINLDEGVAGKANQSTVNTLVGHSEREKKAHVEGGRNFIPGNTWSQNGDYIAKNLAKKQHKGTYDETLGKKAWTHHAKWLGAKHKMKVTAADQGAAADKFHEIHKGEIEHHLGQLKKKGK